MSRRAVGGAAVLVLVAALAVFAASALARVSHMQREIEGMERDLASLRARNDALMRTVDRLRTDPAYLETIAREDLGWVREGDTVLKFPSERK
ncbi:MAG TPA: septum formation initiator family protein [Methylomirabilota bacterium]|nr:septum formation initiator family protein [Methylomirabilota bacterium]